MNEQIIKDTMKKELDANVLEIERLMGGMSNYTYYVKTDKGDYSFRIPGKNSENFVDRKVEKDNLEHIKPYDFCPFPVYLNVDNGYKIAPFIPGEAINELSDLPYKSVAAILHKLHNIDKFDHDYEPLNRLEKYESLTQSVDPVYSVLKDKWLNIYNTSLKDVELKACHGDAQTANFVLDENNNLILMDWEFAGNNDPMYDIACFGNSNFDAAINLLEVYYENPKKVEFLRLYAWRMFQCLQWHNVAKHKHELGLSDELAVNFAAVADAYLEKAKGLLQDYLDMNEES